MKNIKVLARTEVRPEARIVAKIRPRTENQEKRKAPIEIERSNTRETDMDGGSSWITERKHLVN